MCQSTSKLINPTPLFYSPFSYIHCFSFALSLTSLVVISLLLCFVYSFVFSVCFITLCLVACVVALLRVLCSCFVSICWVGGVALMFYFIWVVMRWWFHVVSYFSIRCRLMMATTFPLDVPLTLFLSSFSAPPLL